MVAISAQIRDVGDAPLKKLLKHYGGWPLLDKNWIQPNHSLEQMLGQMHGELNEHFLVSVLVAPDDKNSSVNILVVSCTCLVMIYSVDQLDFLLTVAVDRSINIGTSFTGILYEK